MNGFTFDVVGWVINQLTPYSCYNFFSLTSGGTIYLRDSDHRVVDEQLNGGECNDMTSADRDLTLLYLQENERLFGISVENDLLMVRGKSRGYEQVYRKVRAVKLEVLAKQAIPE